MGPASAAGAGAGAAAAGPTARRPRRPRQQHRPTCLTLSAAAVAATAAASLAWTAEGAGGIVAGGYCSRRSHFPGGPTTASSTACASFVPPVPRAAAAASWARPRHHLCPSPAAAAPAPSALSQRRPVAARPWALGPLAASTESAPDAADAVDDADAGSFKGFLRKNVLLGIEPSPDVAAILVVYFVQGAIGLARLATTFYLKDDLGLSPAESAALSGIFSVPWLLKPLYGFLSDGFPLLGYRRRSYLALSGVLGALSWLALASPGVVSTTAAATLACTLSSLSVAVSDVVADSIVVEKIRAKGDADPKLAGGLQSLCWGSSAIGGIISAYFSGSLLESLGTRGVFGITAALPLFVTLISLAIDEARQAAASVDYRASLRVAKDQAGLLWSAITQPAIYLPLIFLVLWQGSPSSDSAFFYFLTNELKLTPEFLGRVRLATSVASLGGVWLYQRFLRETPIAKILLWTTIASVPLGLTQLILIYHLNTALGIPDEAFMFGDSVVLTVLGQIGFLPTLTLAARLCPPGIEGTLFATLMSVFNGAGALGSELGALLTSVLGVTESNFENLGLLVTICNFSSLLSLPFLSLLGKAGDTGEAETEMDEGETGA